jgi:cellulose synthase (UDP-forming)
MKDTLYYNKFDNRTPYAAQRFTFSKVILFQFFSILFVGVGFSYLYWRWFHSVNPDALWFSIPLVVAETFMFIGSLLMIINHWEIKKPIKEKPVRFLSEINNSIENKENSPISIDIFITTLNEDKLLLEDTIKDVKKLKYPFDDVNINIYLCDDGQRDGRDLSKENFKKLAEKHDINYSIRESNVGYKAGNLNNVFWQTKGDLLVILDADTRVFPDFLKNLTGYFRNDKMAWVQSPQWFYDIPAGNKWSANLLSRYPNTRKNLLKLIPVLKKINTGKDILGTDPRIFYDSILRHRNAANAAFCCGAGSIHRRAALEHLIENNSKKLFQLDSIIPLEFDKIKNKDLVKNKLFKGTVIGPFAHHISEDIYTSILLHSDSKKWESYQHPNVECKMLSPQSLAGYIKQFSRYAEGSFQIFFSKNNPLLIKGLSVRQRIAYLDTFYSYFAPFWIIIFLISPILFYFTLTPPIKAFNFDFFLRFLIFNFLNTIIISISSWGFSTKRSEQYYISSFWYKIKALAKVISGTKIIFNPTSKRLLQEKATSNYRYIIPHLLIVFLTFCGFVYNLILIVKNIHPSYSAFFANSIWAFYNMYQMNAIIRAASKTYKTVNL